MRPRKISDEDILDMARECLLEQGVNVSTQVIAKRLGVSQATLFKRFGTKVKLLQMALWIPLRAKRFLKLLEAEPTEEPILDQLQTLCIHMLQFFDEMIPCWSVLHAAGINPKATSEKSPPIRARLGLTNWIRKLQERERIRQDVEPEAIALALIGAMQHRPLRRHILQDEAMTNTDMEYINSIVEVLWQGLCPQKSKS